MLCITCHFNSVLLGIVQCFKRYVAWWKQMSVKLVMVVHNQSRRGCYTAQCISNLLAQQSYGCWKIMNDRCIILITTIQLLSDIYQGNQNNSSMCEMNRFIYIAKRVNLFLALVHPYDTMQKERRGSPRKTCSRGQAWFPEPMTWIHCCDIVKSLRANWEQYFNPFGYRDSQTLEQCAILTIKHCEINKY